MKKLALLLALLFCLAPAAYADMDSANEEAALAAAALSDGQKELNVFTWTYYIPDEVVEAFEDATGIRVNYASMLGNEDVVPKLSTSPGAYDLIVCSDYIIAELAGLGLLDPIDVSALPNYKNVNPAYQSQYFDPENTYTIPYTNTIPLIVYNPDAVDFEVKGYADLWRPEFQGRLVTVSEWRNVIGLAQKKLGYSYNDADPAHIREVGAELLALKPNIAVMNDDTPHNALISGDAAAGFMYGSQIIAARALLPNLKVVYPEEGLGFGIDCIVTPVGSPRKAARDIFMNYLLDGAVSAQTSELINYGNCNLAAGDYLSETYLADDTVNVPADAVAKAEMMRPLTGDTLEAYNEIWTAFMK